MSRLQAILDQINDIEATIFRIEAEATETSSFGYQMSLQSLGKRRQMLQAELEDATQQEFVEICDYRIVPDNDRSYAVSAVAGILRDFQELVTIVFDAITTHPKKRAPRDLAVIEKTRLNFGFAYSGSLGVALMMRKDRELFESDLDRAITAVFGIMKSDSSEQIHNVATLYGQPAIRTLYNWSKINRDHGLSAHVKWIRDKETRHEVVTQPPEFEEICRLIEARGDDQTEAVVTAGLLVSWDTVHRRFILEVPDAEPISGKMSDAIDVQEVRSVPARYECELVKHTRIDYATDREIVTWELTGLRI